MRDEYIIFKGTAVPQQAFTVNVTTQLITSAAHGLSRGDLLQLTTATTLPAGFSLATNYYVINPTTNTFQLSATPNGPAVAFTDTGTGTETYHLEGKVIYVGDWRNIDLTIEFLTTPTMTVKVQGSYVQDAPDFVAAQSATNRWQYLDCTDASTDTSVDGNTGFACTGSAVHNMIKVTDEGVRWLTVAITAYTQGSVDIRCRVFDERHE